MTSSHATHRRARRGFGTFVAILLLLIVAATLPVLASVFTADARRTRTQADDAQLRQLLMAGAIVAKEQATATAAATTRPSDIPLPQELTDAGAKLTYSLERPDADHATATIHARLGPAHSMEQTVAFERRTDGKWHAARAVLNRD